MPRPDPFLINGPLSAAALEAATQLTFRMQPEMPDAESQGSERAAALFDEKIKTIAMTAACIVLQYYEAIAALHLPTSETSEGAPPKY